MYSTCIYCRRPLGANEAIEHFPVGRRLAFDPARGRLWVVCPKCARWNLSPFEERWEAVEECERRFHDARLRVSTGQIGLARLRDGTELVRIGDPPRGEFAAWRYGGRLRDRRRKYLAAGAVSAAGAGAYLFGATAVFGVAGLLALLDLTGIAALREGGAENELAARVSTGDRALDVERRHLARLRLRPGRGPADEWSLTVQHRRGETMLRGREAVHALGLVLPAVNQAGGSAGRVRGAVQAIEEAGGPERFFAHAERMSRGEGYTTAVPGLVPHVRLALEMAANEEAERAAMRGELALLQSAWREAEEIAAIADRLAVSA